MRVSQTSQLIARAAFCVLFLSAASFASAQGTYKGVPNLLRATTTTVENRINLYWINNAARPLEFQAFAWDVYLEDWVRKPYTKSHIYPFPPSVNKGRINLFNSGAFHVWISNDYGNNSIYLAPDPKTVLVQDGTPHAPIEMSTTVVGESLVLVNWKPEMYGTWLYWIIAYNHNTEEWITTDGPLGESLWHYVAYGDDAFSRGQVPIRVPSRGDYSFLMAGMAWDGQTVGEFESVEINTVPTISFDLPNDVELEMVKIPSGSFEMGGPVSAPGLDGDESPIHTVTHGQAFYIGKYEVTQEQWLAVMGSWPGQDPESDFGVGPGHPAYNVSWNDITGPDGFIDKLNQHISQSGQLSVTFRLPTEAEWEYACRAKTETRFYFGDSLNPANGGSDGPAGTLPGNRSDYMWYWFNSQGDENGLAGAKPVGMKKVNPYGLYDMSGNVWEWCQDWYHNTYADAPADGSAWVTPAGQERVVRGGFWNLHAEDCQSANRHSRDPEARNYDLGFRLVLTEN